MPGVWQVASSFGIILLGAIGGIAHLPLENVSQSTNTTEVIAGVLSGLGKRFIGLVTKPAGGAMKLISQKSQVMMYTTGLSNTPKQIDRDS